MEIKFPTFQLQVKNHSRQLQEFEQKCRERQEEKILQLEESLEEIKEEFKAVVSKLQVKCEELLVAETRCKDLQEELKESELTCELLRAHLKDVEMQQAGPDGGAKKEEGNDSKRSSPHLTLKLITISMSLVGLVSFFVFRKYF